MDQREIDERLAQIERRLAGLELRLGVAPPLQELHAPPAQPPSTPPPPPVAELPPEPPPVVQPPPLPFPPQPVEAIPYVPIAVTPPVFRGPAPRVEPTSLEAQVGLKWAGWVGAVIVVIGAALGIKYAYDQGWFGAFPPAARLALMSLGGFGLIAAGEVVYRRVGALASAGLFGAGVATLFVVSYAGYGLFTPSLFEREAALVMMAVVTLIGAAVAIRGNLVSIAVLSIIGGNVAPILLSSNEPRLVPLMMYLLAMQAVALILAWWGRAAKWWTLRGLAFATICLWMLIPVFAIDEFDDVTPATVLGFVFVYAGLFQLELIVASLREPKPLTTREPGFAVPVPLGQRDGVAEQRGLGVTFSLLVTAALTIAMLVLLDDLPKLERGVWTIGLAALCLALGLILPRQVKNRDPLAPPSAALGLAIGFRIQAAALMVVAVPVLLSGVWITVAWAVLAVALALAGASFNLAVSRVAAVVVWMLAAAHLGLWTLGDILVGGGGGGPAGMTGPHTVWTSILGEPIPAYFVLATLIALAGHAIGTILRADWSPGATRMTSSVTPAPEPPELQHAPDAMDAEAAPSETSVNLQYESRTTLGPPPRAGGVSVAGGDDRRAVAGRVRGRGDGRAAAAGRDAGAGALRLGADRRGAARAVQRVRARGPARAGWSRRQMARLRRDRLPRRVRPRRRRRRLHLQPLLQPHRRRRRHPARELSRARALRIPLRRGDAFDADPEYRFLRETTSRNLGGFAAMLIALWLVTTEIDRYYDTRGSAAVLGLGAWTAQDFARAKQVAISIAWSLFAVACVTLGFAIRRAGLRYFGLALFALTVGKVLLVDMGAVRTGYRVLSFLGLGLLLLGTSVLYGKLSPLLLREAERR